MRKHDMNKIVNELSEKLAGVKGRRNARLITEAYLEEVTGQKHTFSVARETFHHYNIIQDEETGGGDSLFVSFSGSKVKEVSKY